MKKKINKNNKTKFKGFTSFVHSTSNMFFLMMKNHFKGTSFLLGNILIPIITTFSLSILFPIWYSFIWMLFINLTLTAFTAYGVLFFSVRKSTIMKNINMTSSESGSLYTSTLFAILFNTMITLIIVIGTLIFLNFVGIASLSFFYDNSNNNKEVHWLEINWIQLVYYWINSAIVTFSISFVIEKIVSTQKNFFLIVFIYILGGLFFGGIMSLGIEIKNNKPIVITSLDNGYQQGVLESYSWGKFSWAISQLWPHFGLNQISFQILESGTWTFIDGPSKWHDINVLTSSINDPKIDYYIVMPWVYSFIGYWIGGMLAKYDF